MTSKSESRNYIVAKNMFLKGYCYRLLYIKTYGIVSTTFAACILCYSTQASLSDSYMTHMAHVHLRNWVLLNTSYQTLDILQLLLGQNVTTHILN